MYRRFESILSIIVIAIVSIISSNFFSSNCADLVLHIKSLVQVLSIFIQQTHILSQTLSFNNQTRIHVA
jgi:hypothetical protein